MLGGCRYRATSVAGTTALAAVAATVAFAVTRPRGIDGPGASVLALATVCVAVSLSLWPLYRPRHRTVTETIRATVRGVALACLGLVLVGDAIVPGAFEIRAVGVVGALLSVALPPFFRGIGRRSGPSRALVVGDEAGRLEAIVDDLPVDPIGFVSPRLSPDSDGADDAAVDAAAGDADARSVAVADGSGVATVSPYDGLTRVAGAERLGGLSRLRSIVRAGDVDTLAIGFRSSDRGEFFGALEIAAEHDLDVVVHENHRDVVPDADDAGGSLLAVEVDPWPWYGRLGKRAFDACFAAAGLLALSPLIVPIAIAIKLDTAGPVFYEQTRTAAFGGTFSVLKFRSMVTDAEAETGARLSDEDAGDVDPRVTAVGRVLRRTHLDEIPQLVSVLRGDMSVVGPRPERPVFDATIASNGVAWEQRWLLKPGLTGLAQANGVTSVSPAEKLALDVEYASRRSLRLDARLVWLQVRTVLADVATLVTERASE